MRSRIINTEQYPLDQLGSEAGQLLVADTRARLDHNGSCVLPGFVTTRALAEMLFQVKEITHLAYPGPTEVSPYFFNYRLGEDQSLSANHPLLRKGKRNLAQVAADLIPGSFLLRQLYESELMTGFLSAIAGQPIYQNKDPYQSLNISVMNEGGCQQWHFDGGNMVTTLLLQQPENGGLFEYAPAIRNDENENFSDVQTVLDGDSSRVRQVKLEAGSLSLFRGHYSLHRVTEVTGQRQRIQAILGYNTQPDWVGSKESSILHYGPRVAEIEANNPRYPK